MAEPIVYLCTSDKAPTDMKSFKTFIRRIAEGAKDDFLLTNSQTIGKGMKFGAGVLAASHFAKATGTLTPIAWSLSRFGPLPLEFTKSGALRVLSLTTLQRFGAMATVGVLKFAFVTVAYESGIVIGSVAGQFLNQEAKDAIGGTINGIICEQGWKDLWRHPFGYGVWFGPKGERLIDH